MPPRGRQTHASNSGNVSAAVFASFRGLFQRPRPFTPAQAQPFAAYRPRRAEGASFAGWS
jgi:hypothetical protein